MVVTQSPFKTVITRPYIAKAMQFKAAQAESLVQAMLQVFPDSVVRFGLDRYAVMCSGMPVEMQENDWILYSTKYNAFHVFSPDQYQVMFTEAEDLLVVEASDALGVPLTLQDLDAEKPLLLAEVQLMTDVSVSHDLVDKELIHVTPLKAKTKPMTFGIMATNPGGAVPVLGLSQAGVCITKGKFREMLKEACK
jgi:hypothetical protein